MQITTAFTKSFGPDTESVIRLVEVTPAGAAMSHNSSHGLTANRMVTTADRTNGRLLTLGLSPKTPKVIANSTSLGISTAAAAAEPCAEESRRRIAGA